MAADWPTAPLGELVDDILDRRGVTPLKLGSDFAPTGYRVISAKLIKNGRVDLAADEPRFVDEPTYRKWMRTPLDGDDVLLTSEAPLGQAAYIRQPVAWCLGQRLFALRTNKTRLHGRFLYYALQSDAVKHDLQSRATGTTAQGIRQSELRLVRVPLPDISEQRAIAHILGAFDDKIELNRRMNDTLEAIARALFQSWFVNFDPVYAKAEGREPGLPREIADLFPNRLEDSELGELPVGWRLSVLDQFVDVVLGGDWGRNEPGGEELEPTRCVRGADIPDLQMGGTGTMPARFLKPTSLEKRRLKDGDLVVEISGGSPTQSTGRSLLVLRGLLGRLDMPLVCSNFCRMVRLKSPAFSKFVYLWLRSLYARDEFLPFENGTTGIKNLAFTLFSSHYKLCVPPLEVLQAFDELISPLFSKQHTNAAEADTIAGLRDALLPKLISGELRVKDTERITSAAI